MTHPAIAMIEHRISANLFDPDRRLPPAVIRELVRLATRAPSAYNLQNWRFIAVHTPEAKARLRRAAGGQAKVTDAAVTFIIVGQAPDPAVVADRLGPSVAAGFMPERFVGDWEAGVRTMYAGAQMRRDEAIRTATFAAATLIFAAQAHGLASGPMVGFDPAEVVSEFGLGPDEVPVVLVAVGHAAPGNWPQKPRRPVADVLELV